MKVLQVIVSPVKGVFAELKKIFREGLRERNRLARVWIVTWVTALLIGVAYWRFKFELAGSGAVLLILLLVLGFALALAASVEERTNRRIVWGEVGVGLLVAALLALAVWMAAELRRPIEQREALQAMLGFQRDMPGIDLHDKEMDSFDLSGRNLEGANLSGAHLEDASLVRANLEGADLSGADLDGANMEATNLAGADLSGADLSETTASRADFHDARMLDADLSNAELSGANLRGACLADGSLVGASLQGVHLERAALTGADLEDATFWLDLRRAFLAAVGLDEAENTDDAQWPPRFEERLPELIDPGQIAPRPLVKAPKRGVAKGKVLFVPDGDTVMLKARAGRKKVRLIGIDAPELGEEGADSAQAALRALIPPEFRVRYLFDRRRTDNFGRKLVYLFGPTGGLVNQAMLRRGVAVAQIDPPDRRRGLRNVRYARQLAAAEALARQDSRGLWESCPP